MFQLGELALGLKLSSQKGPYLRSDDWAPEGNWLTFLRLKALSSSFSTTLIFLTLMMQRASFPEKQKLFCLTFVQNNTQLHSEVVKNIYIYICDWLFPCVLLCNSRTFEEV